MMQKINCLIIDDEPVARDILQAYCAHLPLLQVAAAAGDALEAKALLLQHTVDLIFVDINMPVLDGISFIKTLKKPPQVIFTTAYKEYALDAFDLAACDYLLKPFSLERFIMAVDKALERMRTPAPAVHETNEPAFFFIRTDRKIYRVLYEELLYAEACGNYTRVVTTQHTLLPNMPFSSFEALLPDTLFIRVHRSFIISKAKITLIEGNRVFINGVEIPIGSAYKDNFMKQLGL